MVSTWYFRDPTSVISLQDDALKTAIKNYTAGAPGDAATGDTRFVIFALIFPYQ